MRILNNFDTNLKQTEYNEAVSKFWEDNVILIQRYVSYWIIRWIVPIFLYICFTLGIVYLLYINMESLSFIFHILMWILLIVTIIFIYRTIRIFIDYKMDFSIITRDEILTHKQIWFLASRYKNFPTFQLKSVYSRRKWLLGNIFWYWEIIFTTDAWREDHNSPWEDSSWSGKIVMTYVLRPNETRKKIVDLCLSKWVIQK